MFLFSLSPSFLSCSLLAHFPFGSEKLHAAGSSFHQDDDEDDDDDVHVDAAVDGEQARQVFSFSFCCC